jgi:hypothetical protein
MPAIGTERRSAPTGNGHARGSLDDTVATPPPVGPAPATPPAEPPSKGGLASRLGRNRNASPSPRGGEPTTGSTPPVTGATPSIASNGTSRPTSRPPVAPPTRTNDTGRSRATDVPRPRNGAPDTGPVARTDRPDRSAPRRPAPEGPNGLAAPGRPTGPGAVSPGGSTPFDGGRLGPSPSAHDTGQIRPGNPSSLPPDLHWAADDTGGGSVNGGPSSPFSGLSSLGPAPLPGPSRPPANDGEIAPHVAAMSPEARAAVQSTVGNAGGSTGRGGSQGEDIAQRGRLISFLSTVR